MTDRALLDLLWVLVSAGLVLFMQAGFLCLESGLVRAKNSINVAIKNVCDFCVSASLYWLLGYGLMYGASAAGLFGTDGFLIDPSTDPRTTSFFLFQLVFCGTAVTIISGAVAERMQFRSYLIVAVVVAALIYPVMGHWAWAGPGNAALGDPGGWLARMGFIDFAGSTVVHSTGGWVALAALLVVGPRRGFGEPGRIAASNLPLAALGVLILWFGWYGFNGGSTLSFDERVPRILVATTLAPAAGGLTGVLVSWLLRRRVEVEHVLNGVLAGLVAITAGCHLLGAGAALVVGAVGSAICAGVTVVMARRKLDDAVGAVPAHAFAGAWGTIAVALFADSANFGGHGRLDQLGIQCLGVGACFVWAFGLGWLLLKGLDRWVRLRVSAEVEQVGLNIAEHGASTALHDLLTEMSAHRRSSSFERPVSVEPHTEVGQIAAEYNRVLQAVVDERARLVRANDEIRRINEELVRARDRALDASRAKSTFLANMSHELRTPMNAILGYTDMLLEEAAEIEERGLIPDLERIRAAGQHLLRLIRDVLSLAEAEAGRMQLEIAHVDVSRLVEDVRIATAPLADARGNRFEITVAGDVESVRMDPDKLRRCLVNVLSNAFEFTTDGTVFLSIRRGPRAGDRGEVVFEVRDTGVGMDEHVLSRLFDAFTQADESSTREHGGTGLGLTLTRTFCRLMGGDVTITSRPEEGTTCTIRLPDPTPTQSEAPPMPAAIPILT